MKVSELYALLGDIRNGYLDLLRTHAAEMREARGDSYPHEILEHSEVFLGMTQLSFFEKCAQVPAYEANRQHIIISLAIMFHETREEALAIIRGDMRKRPRKPPKDGPLSRAQVNRLHRELKGTEVKAVTEKSDEQ